MAVKFCVVTDVGIGITVGRGVFNLLIYVMRVSYVIVRMRGGAIVASNGGPPGSRFAVRERL